MSDTTTNNNTSIIDEKNNENNSILSTDLISTYGKFILIVLVFIIIVFLYFGSSGLILYVCKLAQSNIIPTNNQCYPYTDTKTAIEKINTNIFLKDEMSV